MIILWPLAVSIVGAILYLVLGNGPTSPTGVKAAELGRIAFGCGLIATLFTAGREILRLM